MSYALQQFIQPAVEPVLVVPVTEESYKKYMTPITVGTAAKRTVKSSSGPTGKQDECVTTNNFDSTKNYYFHSKIKKTDNPQTFYIYLVKYSAVEVNEKKQYLKTVVIDSGLTSEWVDIEIVFTPYLDEFDCILFELQRGISDLTPTIVYEELDEINNIMEKDQGLIGTRIVKMGVQAHPGLSMVINGENVHVGNTSIYEIKNNTIAVTSFSVVSAAIEEPTIVNPTTTANMSLEEFLEYLADKTGGYCIFNNSKKRSVNTFSIDYIYEEEEE